LSGAYAVFGGLRALSRADVITAVIVLALGLAYLYLSIRMPKLLRERLIMIKWVLIAASGVLGFSLLSSVTFGNTFLVVVSVLGLLINWYLFRNAKRLAAELRNPPVSASTT
jgi:hypothetical protein